MGISPSVSMILAMDAGIASYVGAEGGGATGGAGKLAANAAAIVFAAILNFVS